MAWSMRASLWATGAVTPASSSVAARAAAIIWSAWAWLRSASPRSWAMARLGASGSGEMSSTKRSRSRRPSTVSGSMNSWAIVAPSTSN